LPGDSPKLAALNAQIGPPDRFEPSKAAQFVEFFFAGHKKYMHRSFVTRIEFEYVRAATSGQ
jgi:hypothetical protein